MRSESLNEVLRLNPTIVVEVEFQKGLPHRGILARDFGSDFFIELKQVSCDLVLPLGFRVANAFGVLSDLRVKTSQRHVREKQHAELSKWQLSLAIPENVLH